MMTHSNIKHILHLARELSPVEKQKLIEQLAAEPSVASAVSEKELDDQYQRGYEQIPEDIAEIEAVFPHLPVPTERWE